MILKSWIKQRTDWESSEKSLRGSCGCRLLILEQKLFFVCANESRVFSGLIRWSCRNPEERSGPPRGKHLSAQTNHIRLLISCSIFHLQRFWRAAKINTDSLQDPSVQMCFMWDTRSGGSEEDLTDSQVFAESSSETGDACGRLCRLTCFLQRCSSANSHQKLPPAKTRHTGTKKNRLKIVKCS